MITIASYRAINKGRTVFKYAMHNVITLAYQKTIM